jgi:flagellar basal body P-ring formation protein FlgA
MKLGLISLLTILFTVMANAATVTVKSYLKIDGGEKIYLHQLIDGIKLPEVVLGSAPALGEQRIFTSKAIAQAVRSLAALKQTNLIIPNEVVVENRGFELSEEAVINDLTARYKAMCADCEISLRSIQLPILPAELKNQPWIIESSTRLPKGAFTEKLLVTQSNGLKSIFWVSGQLVIRKLVPVAARALTFGQRLMADDFRWEWRDVTHASDGIPNEKAILGQKIRLPLQAGDILFSGQIEREKAVHRGEVVQVSAGESQWQVTLEAVTEQDGFIGDVVNVRNRQTNKLVSAEVIGRGKVAVQ